MNPTSGCRPFSRYNVHTLHILHIHIFRDRYEKQTQLNVLRASKLVNYNNKKTINFVRLLKVLIVNSSWKPIFNSMNDARWNPPWNDDTKKTTGCPKILDKLLSYMSGSNEDYGTPFMFSWFSHIRKRLRFCLT